MMNYRVLGWISLTLAVIAAAPFWLRALNQRTVKTRDKRFLSLIKRLRPAHKAAGLLLAFISLTHGWLALSGRLALHTGLLVYAGLLLTALLGIWHYFARDRRVFRAHKTMAAVSFLLLLLHLIKPWAIGQWFGIW